MLLACCIAARQIRAFLFAGVELSRERSGPFYLRDMSSVVLYSSTVHLDEITIQAAARSFFEGRNSAALVMGT
jgi:hypothetical protein